MQPAHELEAVLVAQIDVDERHVRSELLHESNRLRPVGRNSDNVEAFSFEQLSGALEEESVVVNDEAPHRHPLRIHNQMLVRIPANWNPSAGSLLAGRRWQLKLDRQLNGDLRALARPAGDANRAAERLDAVREADEP